MMADSKLKLNLRAHLDAQTREALDCGIRVAAYWRRRKRAAGAGYISALLEKIREALGCGFETIVCDPDLRAASGANDFTATLKLRRSVLRRFFALRALDRKLRAGVLPGRRLHRNLKHGGSFRS